MTRIDGEGYIDDRSASEVVDDVTEAIFHVLDGDPGVTAGGQECYRIAWEAANAVCQTN
jgi:hypothetical protein